mmetsp:Transcript_21092/g.63458  ORF Transcript_21092/g.63458 Transcript_21092/m.63458 type:complete len:540 (-) Transcript_21092:1209-2828(-)
MAQTMDNFGYSMALPDDPALFGYLLDPLTDSSYAEYLPVDDFFDDYLDKLNFVDERTPCAGMQKGARLEPTERMPSGEATSLADSSTQVLGSSPQAGAESQGSQGATNPTTPTTPAGATSGSLSDNSAAGGSYQPPPSQLPAWSHLPAPTANINQGVITSGIQGQYAGPRAAPAQQVGNGMGNAIVSGMPDQLQDRKVPQPKGRRKRVRDERQQMLNKLAQIRYREKKRAKAGGLEGQITALEEQLADLRIKQQENVELAQRNSELEARIAALPVPQPGSGPSSPAHGNMQPPAFPRDTQDDLDDLVKQWLAKSKEIIDLVALIGLGDSNKKAAGRLKNDLRRSLGKQFSSKTRDLLAHVEQRMAGMVSDVTTLCMRVMRLQGAQVDQLMVADYDMVCSLKGWKDERKWIKAAENINFTKEQRTRVLAFREEALAKLKNLYEERKRLNDEVLNGLEPDLFQPASDAQATATAREMVRVLDALAANLAAEQQELAHQDFVLFRELLSPVQSGVLVASSYPDHCDALALMNATAQLPAKAA